LRHHGLLLIHSLGFSEEEAEEEEEVPALIDTSAQHIRRRKGELIRGAMTYFSSLRGPSQPLKRSTRVRYTREYSYHDCIMGARSEGNDKEVNVVMWLVLQSRFELIIFYSTPIMNIIGVRVGKCSVVEWDDLVLCNEMTE
jgi:hypothetical protein